MLEKELGLNLIEEHGLRGRGIWNMAWQTAETSANPERTPSGSEDEWKF